MHQVVEYLVGIALISASVQMPNPTVPALLGLLIILNAAVAKGSAGAFRLVGHRLHRTLDVVVMVTLVAFAVQPWISIDNTSRLLIGGIAFILWFVWFHTDFTERGSRAERREAKRAARAERGPTDSAEVGRQAGRLVGGVALSAKRWKDSLGGGGDEATVSPAPAPTATWDPPTPNGE